MSTGREKQETRLSQMLLYDKAETNYREKQP